MNSTRWIGACLAAAFSPFVLGAQTVAPTRAASEEKVVTMTEFEVATDRDTAYRANNAVSSNRSNMSLFDTPQAITVLTEAFLRDLEAINVNEALVFIPGVVEGEAGAGGGEQIQMRGQAVPETLLDNMPDLNTNVRPDPAIIERVEVIKGSSSALYGSSWPGGVVNSITKKPKAKRAAEIALQFGSDNLRRQTIDFTGPINASKTLLYRFVAAYEEADSFREQVNSDRWTLLPALTYILKPGTQVTVTHEHLESRQTADAGLPIFNGDVTVRLPRERFLSLPDRDFEIFKRASRAFLDHRFNPNWSMRAGFVYSSIVADKQLGQLTGNANAVTRVQARRINRQYITTRTHVAQADVLGRFKTGPFSHRTLIGVDARFQDNNLATYFQNITPANVNVDRPTYTYTLAGAQTTNVRNTAKSESYGAFVQDQASLFEEKLQFVVGLRLDALEQETTSLTRPLPSSYTPPQVVTPRYAVLWHPVRNLTLYATYGESFRPDVSGRPIFGTDRKLDPTTGVLHEVGAKARLFDGRLSLEVDVFELSKEGMVVADPNHPGFVLQSGLERSKGYSISFNADPLPGFTVFGGFGYTDGRVISDSNPTLVGRRLQGTPQNMFTLFGKYRVQSGVLKGLGAGMGVRWLDDRPGGTNSTLIWPSYTVVTAQVNYSWRNYGFNVAVNNLFDEHYWANVASFNGNRAGAPLSFRASVRTRF